MTLRKLFVVLGFLCMWTEAFIRHHPHHLVVRVIGSRRALHPHHPHHPPPPRPRTSASVAMSMSLEDVARGTGGALIDVSASLPENAAPIAAVALGGSFLLYKLFVYSRMEFVSASMVSGIPPGSKVVELDAKDGKNVFYLSKDTDYTAVMSAGSDPNKAAGREAINTQLILESIGKANRGGLRLQGTIRSKTREIPSKSIDVVLSTGAIARSDSGAVELVAEAFRMLRPGGLFVFCEPDGDQSIVSSIIKVFPETISGGTPSAGEKRRKAAATKRSAAEEMSSTRKTKGLKGSGSSMSTSNNENVSQFSAADADASVESGGSVATGGDESEVAVAAQSQVESAESAETEAEAQAQTQTQTRASRPGISYERISNFIDPYVTGIAVKP